MPKNIPWHYWRLVSSSNYARRGMSYLLLLFLSRYVIWKHISQRTNSLQSLINMWFKALHPWTLHNLHLEEELRNEVTFTVAPTKVPKEEIITKVEFAKRQLPTVESEKNDMIYTNIAKKIMKIWLSYEYLFWRLGHRVNWTEISPREKNKDAYFFRPRLLYR